MLRRNHARAGWRIGLIALLAVLGAAACAADLQVGQPAPDFGLPDQDGLVHHLAAYRGKTVVLAFYPKDFTAG
jgi:peroxiredoxin Q/BCP